MAHGHTYLHHNAQAILPSTEPATTLAEREYRKSIFEANMEAAAQHNAASNAFKQGPTPFSDLTASEFMKMPAVNGFSHVHGLTERVW